MRPYSCTAKSGWRSKWAAAERFGALDTVVSNGGITGDKVDDIGAVDATETELRKMFRHKIADRSTRHGTSSRA